MGSDYDPTDFVDRDFQAHKAPTALAGPGAAAPLRAPTREEVDTRVVEAQQKLAELKRVQEELERERSSLEETRRRQMEFQTGRQELVHHLTRGLGLLEEAEFTARRDAEQMTKTLGELREALTKLESIHEEGWTKENFGVELTRALTTIENARMEWNSARLKFPVLTGQASPGQAVEAQAPARETLPLTAERSFLSLCRVGLALTWPVALALLAVTGALFALFYYRH
jgi:hypothetical protein